MIGGTIEALENDFYSKVSRIKRLTEALRKAGMICLDGDKGDSCLIHPRASHDVEACSVAEDLLQGMMDKGLIEVCDVRKGGGDVCMQSADKV